MPSSQINVRANLLVGDGAELRDVVVGAAGCGAESGHHEERDQALKHKQEVGCMKQT